MPKFLEVLCALHLHPFPIFTDDCISRNAHVHHYFPISGHLFSLPLTRIPEFWVETHYIQILGIDTLYKTPTCFTHILGMFTLYPSSGYRQIASKYWAYRRYIQILGISTLYPNYTRLEKRNYNIKYIT